MSHLCTRKCTCMTSIAFAVCSLCLLVVSTNATPARAAQGPSNSTDIAISGPASLSWRKDFQTSEFMTYPISIDHSIIAFTLQYGAAGKECLHSTEGTWLDGRALRGLGQDKAAAVHYTSTVTRFSQQGEMTQSPARNNTIQQLTQEFASDSNGVAHFSISQALHPADGMPYVTVTRYNTFAGDPNTDKHAAWTKSFGQGMIILRGVPYISTDSKGQYVATASYEPLPTDSSTGRAVFRLFRGSDGTLVATKTGVPQSQPASVQISPDGSFWAISIVPPPTQQSDKQSLDIFTLDAASTSIGSIPVSNASASVVKFASDGSVFAVSGLPTSCRDPGTTIPRSSTPIIIYAVDVTASQVIKRFQINPPGCTFAPFLDSFAFANEASDVFAVSWSNVYNLRELHEQVLILDYTSGSTTEIASYQKTCPVNDAFITPLSPVFASGNANYILFASSGAPPVSEHGGLPPGGCEQIRLMDISSNSTVATASSFGTTEFATAVISGAAKDTIDIASIGTYLPASEFGYPDLVFSTRVSLSKAEQ